MNIFIFEKRYPISYQNYDDQSLSTKKQKIRTIPHVDNRESDQGVTIISGVTIPDFLFAITFYSTSNLHGFGHSIAMILSYLMTPRALKLAYWTKSSAKIKHGGIYPRVTTPKFISDITFYPVSQFQYSING